MGYKFSLSFLTGIVLVATSATAVSAAAQPTTPSGAVSLDSCRSMALANNKSLQISRQAIQTADYVKKEAKSAYLPGLDFNGGYMYNQKSISLLEQDAMLPVKVFIPEKGAYDFKLVTNPQTGAPVMVDGKPVPAEVALLPKEAMEFNIHNVFFGAVTLTQPVYMGGKIRALNEMSGYAADLARALHESGSEDVIYAVDGAYWQVVSLKAKHDLAKSYVELLESLDSNVGKMVDEGVATRSQKLQVDVKLNEARVDLTKVENGLVLSRMALAKVCGLPLNTVFTLEDEESKMPAPEKAVTPADIEKAYERRGDLRALELGIKIAGQQKKIAKASMLPNVAVVGAYSFSNPNAFDGFKTRFNGGFSVGAMVSIPIWHWGGNYNKYKAAESQETTMKLRLEDARELVDLQITQAGYRAQEALKTYRMTTSNLEAADENLRSATVGFKEGVMTSDDVMKAQTAWLKANSENIDAMIDIHLCDTYLSKVLGTLN